MSEKKQSFFGVLFKGINFIRLVIVNFFFFALLFMFFSVMAGVSSKEQKTKPIVQGSILVIEPEGILSEEEQEFEWIQNTFFEKNLTVLLSDLTEPIKKAAVDRRIEALYMDFSSLRGLSSAHFSELAEALKKFKESGKPIYSYSAGYGLGGYYLASFADKIGLDPLGGISFQGFAVQSLFFKDMYEKLGIRFNVAQAGNFKGAAENFYRDSMSEGVKANLHTLVSDMWASYAEDIAVNKKISVEVINNFANNYHSVLKKYKGDSAEAALKEGLVNELADEYGFRDMMEKEVSDLFKGEISWASYKDYLADGKSSNEGGAKVGVIRLSGAITSSRSERSANLAVASELVSLLNQAEENPEVKAVVLRVDSGGGEVFASEEIRRALIRVKEEGKPVVVSMGSAAASGAYWISSAADYIFASPYTVTGSIGVLSAVPSIQNFLKDKLGITVDGTHAGHKPLSIFQDFSQEEAESMQLEVNSIYKKFIERVSENRNLSFEEVEKLAGGQVYSGKKALTLKLVDSLGSLNDAIEHAANLANISEDFSAENITKPLSPMHKMLKAIAEEKISLNSLYELRLFKELSSLNSKKGFYLYAPERFMWTE